MKNFSKEKRKNMKKIRNKQRGYYLDKNLGIDIHGLMYTDRNRNRKKDKSEEESEYEEYNNDDDNGIKYTKKPNSKPKVKTKTKIKPKVEAETEVETKSKSESINEDFYSMGVEIDEKEVENKQTTIYSIDDILDCLGKDNIGVAYIDKRKSKENDTNKEEFIDLFKI